MMTLKQFSDEFINWVDHSHSLEKKTRSVAMTRNQADLIIMRMPDGDARDALSILRATGMRPKEVFSMRWEYVDFEAKIYQNPKGKTKNARRTIPLLSPSCEILLRRR